MIDLSLDNGSIITTEEELIIQQVDILFDTAKREVLGALEYGTDYDQFLHNMHLSNESIAYQIKNDMVQLNLFGYEPEVEVGLLEGTLNDIILIKVGLRKKDRYYEKIYSLR